METKSNTKFIAKCSRHYFDDCNDEYYEDDAITAFRSSIKAFTAVWSPKVMPSKPSVNEESSKDITRIVSNIMTDMILFGAKSILCLSFL